MRSVAFTSSHIKMETVPEEGLRNRWIFTKEQLQNSPSRADGISQEKELSCRQQAASLIQDMGPKLNVYAPLLGPSSGVCLLVACVRKL